MDEDGRELSRTTMCRGVRGAITVSSNNEDEILEATRELLQAILLGNEMRVEDIASATFTMTTDLTATYPAYAARQLGWFDTALMCGHEIAVPGGLARCIRVLIHWNTTKTAKEIVHVYLREARSLRPDRKNVPPIRPRQISPVEAAVRFLSMTL
jgi:chorismate mutase